MPEAPRFPCDIPFFPALSAEFNRLHAVFTDEAADVKAVLAAFSSAASLARILGVPWPLTLAPPDPASRSLPS